MAIDFAKSIFENSITNGDTPLKEFERMLDFFIDIFSVPNLYRCNFSYEVMFVNALKANKEFTFILKDWMSSVSDAIENGEVLDYFGQGYEEYFKTGGKASNMGQFYTPHPVFKLGAKMITHDNCSENIFSINDPACGSGRGLLECWNESNRPMPHLCIGMDLDSLSVKMCALNLMIYGIYGKVYRHDTLRNPVGYDWGFAVNEALYPFC